MLRASPCWPGALSLAASMGLCGVAAASDFDAAGQLVFDTDAAWTYGSEKGEWEPSPPADGGEPRRFTIEEDTGALEGERVVALPRFGSFGVSARLPAGGASYRLTAWARGDVFGEIEASYVPGRVADFGVLYPTGRVTSDGWYELGTQGFSVEAARLRDISVGFFSPAAEGAAIDAIEMVREGPPISASACRGIGDKAACGPTQVCSWGRCQNMTSRVPPLPPPDVRDDLVGYLDGRLDYLFGPFENRRRDLPNARTEIEGMRAAPNAWAFWRGFRNAINRLHDSHTRSSDAEGFVLESPRPIGLCFLEGVADRSQTAAPSPPGTLDVLVSRVGSTNTFGLRPGDRLVSIDGKHPIEWGRSLVSVASGFGTASNHQTNGEIASSLNGRIGRFAERIEVIRCEPSTGTCAGSTEIISIHDLPPSPPGTRAGVSCDNRPLRHVKAPSTSGVRSAIVDESDETEAIYGLQWNSLYVSGSGGGVEAPLRAAVAEWRQKARGVILDHRRGDGGTNLGPPILWDFVRQPIELDAFLFRQRSAQKGPQSVAEGLALFDALASQGLVERAGSDDPVLDVPVALLITVDVSASDWLPLGVKGAPNSKIFGPYQTSGAFSTLFGFSYWGGLGYSIAVGDTIHASGRMLNGTGVEPDVVVLPKQSDLLAGRDTVYDAALAWVRENLKP